MIRLGTFTVGEVAARPGKVWVRSDYGEAGEFNAAQVEAAMALGPVKFERWFWENF